MFTWYGPVAFIDMKTAFNISYKRHLAWFLVPALIALATLCQGRVFWSQRIGPGTALSAFPGWTMTYEAPVRVNGAEGAIETWSCAESFDVVCTRLNAMAGTTEKPGIADRTIFLRTVFTEGSVSRMIAIDFGKDRACQVLALHQKQKDYETMFAGTKKQAVTDLQPHPGGQIQLTVENLDTDVGFDLVNIPAMPADVLLWADTTLVGAGWSNPDATGGMFGGSRLRLYTKGQNLIFIQISGNAHEQNSTLAVLQKKLN